MKEKNDIEFLKAIAKTLRDHGENIPDLNTMEEIGDVVFLPLGGSSLTLWSERLKVFNRPEFYIFDRDTTPPELPKSQAEIDKVNSRRWCRAVSTSKREMENYLHPLAIKAIYPDVDIVVESFDDVPLKVAQILHERQGLTPWGEISDSKKDEKEKAVKKQLNTKAVAQMTPELLNASDPENEIRGWLQYISQFLSD